MKSYLLASCVLIIAATTATAADVSATDYDWTGFYVGLNGGGAFNNSSVSNVMTNNPRGPNGGYFYEDQIEANQTKFTVGGLAGYNWQSNSFLLGVETDLNYLGFDASNDVVTSSTSEKSLSTQTDWYGTLRGRVGFVVDKFLIYGTGGLAYGRVKSQGRVDEFYYWKGSESNINMGWTLGAGLEYAVNPDWTVGAEYQYVDLGKNDFDYDKSPDNSYISTEVSGHVNTDFSIIKATLKYKF